MKNRFDKVFDRMPVPVQVFGVLVGYFIILTPVALAVVVVAPFMLFAGGFAGMGSGTPCTNCDGNGTR